MKRSWALFGSIFATGCATSNLAPASLGGGEHWVEVVTPHFVLSTNQFQPQAIATARALEEARAALLYMAWTGAREPPRCVQSGCSDLILSRAASYSSPHPMRSTTTGARR